jgi:HEPN domain-containing protein
MPLRKCPYCKGLSNFSPAAQVGGGHLKGLASLDICQNCNTPVYFVTPTTRDRDTVWDSYPKTESEPDKELPEDVRVAFSEAIKGLNDGNWNSCVVMCRRALEESMTDLGAEGEDLFHKIDDLESKRKITPELKEWAHESRLGGKLGAHGTRQKKWADKDDAEEVLEFSRWFFRYVYVLQKQLADRKAKVTPTGNEATSQETV